MQLLQRISDSINMARCYKQSLALYYEARLLDHYRHTPCHVNDRYCIYMVDGTEYNPGLCDKLRGILSIYSLCKSNLKFKINWTFPFDLTAYLIPNRYDWTINSQLIKYCENTRPVVIDCAPDLLFQELIDRLTFYKRIRKSPYSQIHVYSNIIVNKNKFKFYFNELFTPALKLSDALQPHRAALGNNYISFSLRFMELLGDFKDQEGISKPLPPVEQTRLIEKCVSKLISVLDEQPKGTKAFVASDSKTFIDIISKRDSRVYVVPGDIVHVRYKGSENAYLKAFVDLFLIKEAKTQYLLRTGLMYNSGFPRFASWIGNNDFRLIEF